MGAKIGKGVRLSPAADIKEFDLLTIGDDCVLDACTVSPFALVSGGFELRPITLGARTVMAPKSIAAPGSTVPEDGYVSHSSSSHECGAGTTEEEREAARLNAKGLTPTPHFLVMLLVCYPTVFLIEFIANIPVMAAIYGMIAVIVTSKDGFQSAETVSEGFLWFAEPERLLWMVAIKLVRDFVCPVVYVTIVLLFKRLVLGRFKAGPRTHSQGECMRYWFTDTLITKSWQFDAVCLVKSIRRARATTV